VAGQFLHVRGGLVQLVLVEDADAVAGEQGGGDPLAGDAAAAEGAVVDLAAAAGRASLLEHRHPQPFGAGDLQRAAGAAEESLGDVIAGLGDHGGGALEHGGATRAADLCGRPRYRQTAGHLRAKRHHPPLRLPSAKDRAPGPGARAVVADALAEQASADQDSDHRGSG
jgi:hypothetical protein